MGISSLTTITAAVASAALMLPAADACPRPPSTAGPPASNQRPVTARHQPTYPTAPCLPIWRLDPTGRDGLMAAHSRRYDQCLTNRLSERARQLERDPLR